MTVDKSKFQVISILTGTGFTTTESESMLITKRRRLLTQRMMLFSYIFNIVIVSTLVNLLMSTSSTNINEIKLGVFLTIVNIFLIFFVRKSRAFKRFLDGLVVRIAKRKSSKTENSIIVYDNYGTEVIAEVELYKLKEFMKGKTLKQLQLREKYNIQILMIRRKDQIIEHVRGDTIVQEKDVIVVFGRFRDIRNTLVKQYQSKKEN